MTRRNGESLKFQGNGAASSLRRSTPTIMIERPSFSLIMHTHVVVNLFLRILEELSLYHACLKRIGEVVVACPSQLGEISLTLCH